MVPFRTFNIHGTISIVQKVLYCGKRFIFKLLKMFLSVRKTRLFEKLFTERLFWVIWFFYGIAAKTPLEPLLLGV